MQEEGGGAEAWRQIGVRLGDVTEAGRPVWRGLEVILQIQRLGGHFCGDHGASATPPSQESILTMKTKANHALSCSVSYAVTPCM